MAGDLDRAIREIVRDAVRDALEELLPQRLNQIQHTSVPATDKESRMLLNARETAKRLAISERHLFQMTADGVFPCVRLGRVVRYNVETVKQRIQDAEAGSAEKPKGMSAAKEAPADAINTAASKLRSRRSTSAAPMPAKTSQRETRKGNSKSRRPAARERDRPNDGEDRPSPFRLLLQEIGVDRNDLGPLTNGDLIRIAEVDSVAMHGWMHLGRPLPEDALEKLRQHFRKLTGTTS